MKLIDKDALVAEIEKRLNYRIESLKTINNGTFWKKGQSEDEFNESLTRCAFNAAKNELFELKCFLDTLEVKEVDFEEELKHYCNDYYNCDYPKQIEEGSCSEVMPHIVSAAKHFFELGLKIRKDLELTWENIKTIDKLLNQCVDYSNPYQEVLKRFKVMKDE